MGTQKKPKNGIRKMVIKIKVIGANINLEIKFIMCFPLNLFIEK
jgi:hypothetical protein